MKVSAVLTSLAAVALAAPAPRANNALTARDNTVLFPHGTFRYWINTGDIKQDPQDQPLIVKNGNSDDETSTIVTFKFDEHAQGRKCELLFDLWDRDVSTGSQTLDVFSVINPPTSAFTISTIPEIRPAASRDQHRGRMHVPKPGSGEWIMSYNGYPQFDCPAAGELMGVEYVGVGDEVQVRWDIGVTGPRVRVL